MAFTSETILKFGSDAIEFAVVNLLDYSLENEKAGAFNYRRRESISVVGLFSNRESNTPIEEHFRQVKLLLESNNQFVDLKINDLSYGKARILSYSFPTSVAFDENSVRFSRFTINMEVFKDDSSGTYADANLPSSVSSVTDEWYKLRGFQENISFTLQEDNNFLVTHSISFGVDNIDKVSSSEVVTFANGIANSLFALGLDSLSDIRSLYSSTSFQVSNTDYGSSLVNQTSDLINYNFSYSKNYRLFSNNSTNFTETIVHDFSYGQNGVIEVTERGRIKGKGSDIAAARQYAINRLEANLADAYTARCNPFFQYFFSTYYSSFDSVLPKYNSSDTLKSNAISITKDLSGIENEVGYEIKFTTNAAYENSTRIHSYSVELTERPDGILDGVVRGEVAYYTNKFTDFNKLSDFKTQIIDASDIAKFNPYYYKIKNVSSGNYAGVRKNTEIQYKKFGASMTYAKNYSDDKSLDTGDDLITSINISTSTNFPVNRFSTVDVLNDKEIIYQTRALTEGNRSISINMTLDREEVFKLDINGGSSDSSTGKNTDPSTVFEKIRFLLDKKMLDKTNGYLMGTNDNKKLLQIFAGIFDEDEFKNNITTFFMDSLNLSVNSSYNLSVDSNFKFLLAKEK